MFNVSGGKFAVVALIAMIVLGPDKLPNAARQVGRFLHEFRRIRANLENEVRSAIHLADQTKLPGDPAAKKTPGP
jgi:sec-independent protein translocase protein TatB